MPICSITDRFQRYISDRYVSYLIRNRPLCNVCALSYCVGGPVVAFNSAVVSGHELLVAGVTVVFVWWHTATLFYLFYINE